MKKKHMYRNYVEFDKDLKLYEVVDHYYPEKTLNLSKRNAEGVRKSISENKDLAEFHTLKDFIKVQDIKNIYQDYYIQKQYSNPSLKLAPHQTALIPKDCELYQAHACKEGALLNPSSSF